MCLAVVLIISLVGVMTGAGTKMSTIFLWVDPVYYVSTEIQFESGKTSYDWNITVLNPCSNFFTNATPDNGINAALWAADWSKIFSKQGNQESNIQQDNEYSHERCQAKKTGPTCGRRGGARRHASSCVGDQRNQKLEYQNNWARS